MPLFKNRFFLCSGTLLNYSCNYLCGQPYAPGQHQVFRLAQVRPDKDLKMPVLTALIIPALADMPAAAAARRKSNRNTSIALVEERLIVRTWAPCSGRHSSARPQAFDAVE